MANRLKPWIDDIISENHSIFISNIAIQDNLIITREAFHSLKTAKGRKRGAMALKIDLKKANDMVDWNFLKKVIRKMGFLKK